MKTDVQSNHSREHLRHTLFYPEAGVGPILETFCQLLVTAKMHILLVRVWDIKLVIFNTLRRLVVLVGHHSVSVHFEIVVELDDFHFFRKIMEVHVPTALLWHK